MIYRGKVRGGVVVLQGGTHLPEDLDVMVEPLTAEFPPSSPVNDAGVVRNGVPVFPRIEGGAAPGLDLVNHLRDEKP